MHGFFKRKKQVFSRLFFLEIMSLYNFTSCIRKNTSAIFTFITSIMHDIFPNHAIKSIVFSCIIHVKKKLHFTPKLRPKMLICIFFQSFHPWTSLIKNHHKSTFFMNIFDKLVPKMTSKHGNSNFMSFHPIFKHDKNNQDSFRIVIFVSQTEMNSGDGKFCKFP